MPEKIVYSDEDDNPIPNPSSSDNSDDETNVHKRKRPVESKCTVSHQENPPKKKKYSIWSNLMQEDEIENSFVSSDFFGGGRGNESYNYKQKLYENVNDNPHSK
jgi:hypothetical protein